MLRGYGCQPLLNVSPTTKLKHVIKVMTVLMPYAVDDVSNISGNGARGIRFDYIFEMRS